MYGKSPAEFPQRIVCLTAGTAEIAFAVGAGRRVVGVPGTVCRPPEARELARSGAFTTFRADRILALEPDLVVASSGRGEPCSHELADLPADVAADLVRAGVAVLCTNPCSFDDVLRATVLLGGALGLEREARDLVQDMQDEVRQMREYSSVWPDRPRVYFEEWFDPLIAGIGWVSDLIEIAGGRDVFRELRTARAARDRVVAADDVVRRDPEILLASWCGEPVDRAAIAARPGWAGMTAVRTGEVHEVEGADVLVAGPSLMVGLRRIHEVVQTWRSR